MNDMCGRFHFAVDMNVDGVFTVSDVGLLAKQIFHLPANLIIWLFEQEPQLAAFFEINCSTGTEWGAVIFSPFVWWVVFTLATVYS